MGSNNTFARSYVLVKMFSILMQPIQLLVVIAFVGDKYLYFGIDVISQRIEESWPNPMLIIFPKVSKCEYAETGISGDIQLESVKCQLPLNEVVRYLMLGYWYWLILSFVINVYFTMILLFRIIFFINIPDTNFGDKVLLHFLKINLDRIEYFEFYGKIVINSDNIDIERNENDEL